MIGDDDSAADGVESGRESGMSWFVLAVDRQIEIEYNSL